MNGYDLSRQWFDFAFHNPSKVSMAHQSLMFGLIEMNNRLGWKNEFGLSAKEGMELMQCRSYNTYKKTFDELIVLGFVILIKKSINQYQCNIIALSNFDKAPTKAIDKATVLPYQNLIKQGESTVQSTDDIHKTVKTVKTVQKEAIQEKLLVLPDFDEPNTQSAWNDWKSYRKERKKALTPISEKKQIGFLKKFDSKTVVEIIDTSIRNGWTGLFELKAVATIQKIPDEDEGHRFGYGSAPPAKMFGYD